MGQLYTPTTLHVVNTVRFKTSYTVVLIVQALPRSVTNPARPVLDSTGWSLNSIEP